MDGFTSDVSVEQVVTNEGNGTPEYTISLPYGPQTRDRWDLHFVPLLHNTSSFRSQCIIKSILADITNTKPDELDTQLKTRGRREPPHRRRWKTSLTSVFRASKSIDIPDVWWVEEAWTCITVTNYFFLEWQVYYGVSNDGQQPSYGVDRDTDHPMMYGEGFHRDVSTGNILIQPASTSRNKDLRALVSDTFGILVDLDHAKYTSVKTVPGKIVPSHATVRELMPIIKYFGHDVAEDVVAQGLKFADPVDLGAYIKQAKKLNVMNSKPNGSWSAKGLGWEDVGEKHSFTSRQPDLRALVSTTSGVLIDLDHAKYTTAQVVPGQGAEVLPSDEIRQEVWILNECRGLNIKEDVVVQGLKFADPIGLGTYIKQAKKLKNSNPNGSWSAKDLGWGDVGVKPSFTSRQPDLRTLVSTSGVLIDLDHAKYTTAQAVPGEDTVVLSSDEIQREVWILNESRGQNIKEDVVVQGSKLISNLNTLAVYIEEATKRDLMNSNPNGPSFAKDLGWGDIGEKPSFASRQLDLRVLVSSGVLINLDHAKFTVARTVPKRGAEVLSSDALQEGVQVLKKRRRQNIEEDVVVQGLKLLADPDDIGTCIKQAEERNTKNLNSNGPWSAKDLGWEDVGEKPDFTSRQPAVNECMGTLPPFVSHQLTLWDGVVTHDAIHDLESFLWTLVYLVLTREFKRGKKRTDLSPKLVELIAKLFEEDGVTVSHMKSIYFVGSSKIQEDYVEELLMQFHEYFDPLKPMLRRWRDVLILGYTFEAYEFYRVHYFIAKIIRDTLSGLPEGSSEEL